MKFFHLQTTNGEHNLLMLTLANKSVAVEVLAPVFTDRRVRDSEFSAIDVDRADELGELNESHYLGHPIYSKTPITSAVQLNWLLHEAGNNAGNWLVRRMRQRIDHSGRFGRVMDMIKERVQDPTYQERVQDRTRQEVHLYTYHHGVSYMVGTSWGMANYKNRVRQYKKLGALVCHAIHSQDVSDLQDFLMESASDGVDIERIIFNRIKEGLAKHDVDLDMSMAGCGHYERDGNIHSIGRRGNDTVCESCHESEVEYCEDGDYDDMRENLWEHSNGNYYSYEEEDEEDEDDTYSDDDSSTGDPDQLMGYSVDVTRILEPDHSILSSIHGEFRMGVELEMVGSGDSYSEINASVADVRKQLGEDYCICKSDGSLPQGGIEIVTAPRGLAEHIKNFKAWNINPSYRAWDTGRCGMHIHIHSKAFTPLTLGKFIMLVNSDSNADFIRKIAGRHPLRDSQARDYCASESQDVLDNPNHALKGKASSRYRMVNCENMTRSERSRLAISCDINKPYDTVELRIFKASLKKERLLAQIEFTHALVMFCRVASWSDLTGESFKKWLKATRNAYPHLADWYGIRRRSGAKNSAPTEGTCVDIVTAPDNTSFI